MSDWSDPKPEDEGFPFAMDGVEVLGEGFQTFDTTTDAEEAEARLEAEAKAFFVQASADLVATLPDIEAKLAEWPNQPTAAVVATALTVSVVAIQNETMGEAVKGMAESGDPTVLYKAMNLCSILERIPQMVAILVNEHTNPTQDDA
jgi:hypothetical protein